MKDNWDYETPGELCVLISVDLRTTLEDVGWTHVYLCHHHEHRNIQRQGQTQVFFGHPDDTRITAHLGGVRP